MSAITIRAGGYAPPDSTHSRALDQFKQTLEADLGSGIEVELLYNVMELDRPASDLLDMVRNGELTWCYFSTSYLGKQVAELNALEVPFLFSSLPQAHAALDGAFGDRLTAATREGAGYEVLGFWDNGFRHLTNRLRPIRNPGDAAGMSIRLQPNRVHEALVAAWGMTPVAVELSRAIAMIKAGEVDAQENPLANTVAYGVDHPFVTLSAHLYGARGLFANRVALAGLPSAVAAAVRRAARRAIEFQRAAAEDYEQVLRDKLEAEGRQIVEPTAAERDEFRAASADVIAAARAQVGNALLDLIDES